MSDASPPQEPAQPGSSSDDYSGSYLDSHPVEFAVRPVTFREHYLMLVCSMRGDQAALLEVMSLRVDTSRCLVADLWKTPMNEFVKLSEKFNESITASYALSMPPEYTGSYYPGVGYGEPPSPAIPPSAPIAEQPSETLGDFWERQLSDIFHRQTGRPGEPDQADQPDAASRSPEQPLDSRPETDGVSGE